MKIRKIVRTVVLGDVDGMRGVVARTFAGCVLGGAIMAIATFWG